MKLLAHKNIYEGNRRYHLCHEKGRKGYSKERVIICNAKEKVTSGVESL